MTFKKAVLSLTIIPQITPDNKIVLRIRATEDTRGDNVVVSTTPSGTGPETSTSVPAINTQAVESDVLLNNNETVVLGGVYKTVKENTVDRIPFLGSLPVVGYLFSHKREHDEKRELLIFITPKIITSNPVSAYPIKR